MQRRTLAIAGLPLGDTEVDPNDQQESPTSTDSGYQSRHGSKTKAQQARINRDRKAFIRALVQPSDFHSPEFQRLGIQPYYYQVYRGKIGPDYACQASCLEIATYGRSVALGIATISFLVTGAASKNDALLR
ncbi:hypothetical protein CLAFUW4_06806 [Fulvia fulva]|uniref:Uncharacterized protein n=1 Tax=Passalora fulva TaxID=5499 RepID=A0A9Q8UQJ1_PASFU|nr:uncharacterized protein CLAFUR5_06943 [Fulvia fulva]KAK4621428.1 hypothetical protein CLAFUR4_06814 [Fulvia fulva]KAK4622781.1 hypothetical protein CLAFUR0_06809 [Fulvia fulva]UJO18746.1 hypothetical protein CLAFUR5_06943 [Fulvia fulva]WPV16374.1 hypothetical protein CLAFUW4_06806 [Fulvia fulva]WPV30717.1 hypothetical protein CLAFUW7_06805 [Fulvia fulva]